MNQIITEQYCLLEILLELIISYRKTHFLFFPVFAKTHKTFLDTYQPDRLFHQDQIQDQTGIRMENKSIAQQ